MLLTKAKKKDLIYTTESWKWKNIVYKVFSLPIPSEANWDIVKDRLKVVQKGYKLTVSGFVVNKKDFEGNLPVLSNIVEGYKKAGFSTIGSIKNDQHYLIQSLDNKKGAKATIVTSNHDIGDKVIIVNYAQIITEESLTSMENFLPYIVNHTTLILN